MLIYPAIDLLGGRVVRLEQGKKEACTVYSSDPVAFAQQWKNEGAEILHVVDLDGAFDGKPGNLDKIQAIVQSISIPIQLGGGMRTDENVENAFQAGVSRVVIGTRAVESLDFVASLVKRWGGEKIAVGIDAKDGKVAVKGWTEASTVDVLDLAQKVQDLGVQTVIYTDIATDGMFTGPNYPALQKLQSVFTHNIIASGGVATAEHIQKLRQMGSLHGAIVGKALYDKKVTLAEIL
ncbi:MAG: 1-(5-phosphoribosyl)-5-[(5-phosphoribosylamino)methylideneamino]imidazole-4-carboxamide isomerase [Verrucomicrobiota bacterium]